MFFFELFVVVVTGLAVGSFLGVVIDRVTFGKSILGRSHCDYCNRQLSPVALIPVISFFTASGKTDCCGRPLSFWYPVTELVTAIAFVYVWFFLGETYAQKIALMGIFSSLIVITISDIKYKLIADEVQVALVLSTLVYLYLQNPNMSFILSRIWAGTLVAVPLLLIFLFSKGRGMGFADVKLVFSIGLLLGMPVGFLSLYIAFIAGAIVGLLAISLRKKSLKSEIPFGPFLVLGLLCGIFWQNELFSAASFFLPFFGF